MKISCFTWSVLLLFLPFVVMGQVSKTELETFSHIKKEVSQLKEIVLSPKGQMMGQKVLLEMYFFNIGERLSNIESSAFPLNAQELMPLNLKGVKQIDLELKVPLMITEEEISYLVYWEFDDDGNIVKRRISGDMRMSIEEKHENRYASIYDAKSQTLNGYNVYTSYSQEGSYSSKKFTNNKQIPFEVIDGYEYPDSATACFCVEQKDNTVLITQLQYGVKIKEYKFVLNDKKNIQEIVISSLEQTAPDTYNATVDMNYKYTYTYY